MTISRIKNKYVRRATLIAYFIPVIVLGGIAQMAVVIKEVVELTVNAW